MGALLKKIRKNNELHSFLRKIYGKTLGLYWLKDWYAKNIGFNNGKIRIKLLSLKQSEKLIYEKIKSNKPFMVARYGSNEFRNLFDNNEFDTLCSNAGFFPNDKTYLKKFRKEYFESSKKIDILAIWNYQNNFFKKIKLIKKYPNIKHLIPLGSAGQENHKWIKALENKKILIIHPFKATIEQQMKKRKQLEILPKIKKLEVIQAVQTIAGNKDSRFKDWFEALDYMKKEIDEKDFDIALVGCGAYGLPLSAYIKEKKKQVIHMGGGLQLLFGIKGKRWEKSGRFTKYWTYPLEQDVPKNNKIIEGGCYWK